MTHIAWFKPNWNSPLDAALTHAKLGWAVFPLSPCPKRPLIKKAQGGVGLHDATTDLDQIREWWKQNPNDNMGFNCGDSGLVVVEIDAQEDGRKWRGPGSIFQYAEGQA